MQHQCVNTLLSFDTDGCLAAEPGPNTFLCSWTDERKSLTSRVSMVVELMDVLILFYSMLSSDPVVSAQNCVLGKTLTCCMVVEDV